MPLVSTDFAVSFLVANFTTWLQLFIKVFSLSLSYSLSLYLSSAISQKDSSFRLFFYPGPYRFHLNISFHFDYFVPNPCFFVTTCYQLPPPSHFHYYYIPPFSDFSFGATKIVRAIIPRGTKIFALIVLTFTDFFLAFII